ncbi:1-propanol dehydrogenase PduQ [Streptococcus sp. NLN64]|uniref:1-propanol dehydrogenase PduQ n=1 Tax=Streptococcus sp. NLN64 TaxID=2822799 RepID=UPI0018C9CC55|nr:1-propanol dehydrogenase PduQ [Streptococcus sp. NLN64]MBG9366625.1 iron-containing alcohol dehydrogenase [Streptococcus sp. NLN64]
MYRIHYKTELVIGTNALEELRSFQNQGILMVADPFLEKTGQLEYVKNHLDSSNRVTVFTEVCPDPPIEVIVAGIQSSQEQTIDIILAIGGGSALDAAKAIYYFGKKEGGFQEVTLIAIPTTSGTGSEVTDFSVITDADLGRKYPIVDRELLPDLAILDANLVRSLPRQITADTGIDVLTHVLEAYVSTQATDFSDALVEKTVQLVFEYLPKAYRNGQDMEAREKMHIASTMAGMAFNTTSLGIVHSLSHASGAVFHIPHGRMNSILLPKVIAYNAGLEGARIGNQQLEVAKRYQQLARILGCSAPNPAQGVKQLLDKLRQLQRKLDLPETLAAYGIDQPSFEREKESIAESALKDPCTVTNPRQPSVSDLATILSTSYRE